MTDRDPPKKRRRRPSGLVIWLRRVIFTTLLLAGLGMVAIAFMIRHFEEGLPSTAELRRYSPPQVTRILARDGTLLGEDFIERRTVVPLSAIPSHVKLAFLAAEDASFYEHEGLDYPGMLRAIQYASTTTSSPQIQPGRMRDGDQVVRPAIRSPHITHANATNGNSATASGLRSSAPSTSPWVNA